MALPAIELMRKIRGGIGAASLVDQSAMFVVREGAARLPIVRSDRKREATYSAWGKQFVVEHGTNDAAIFREIFWDHLYDMPIEIQSALPSAEIDVLDLGGHVGYFALWVALNLPHARLVAYEPDPANAERYRRMISTLGSSEWAIHEAFAASTDGTVQFRTGQQSEGTRTASADSAEGEAVRAVDILPAIAAADFVKMDIEGGEWEIVLDPRFQETRLRAITMEYHRNFCPVEDYRGLIVETLERNGLTVIPTFHDDDRGLGMLWAYRAEEFHGGNGSG